MDPKIVNRIRRDMTTVGHVKEMDITRIPRMAIRIAV
jgi:hypothetical protein